MTLGLRRIALLLLGGLALLLLWLSGLVQLLWHMTLLWLYPPALGGNHLHLSDYRLDGPPIAFDSIGDNLSGLTYSSARGSLFATINRPQEVVEIGTDGRLLRRITVKGVSDLEGITHIEGDAYILVDEGLNRLNWVTIREDTGLIDVAEAESLQLEPSRFHNMGFEALSWDNKRKVLWVGQEMWPLKIMAIEGIDRARSGEGLHIGLTVWSPKGLVAGSFMDLSSLTLHDETGNILLLSDLTSAVAEFDSEGNALGLLPLWGGFSGLNENVPQPEGVAVAEDGTIFVISEPNLLYRFTRQSAAAD